MLAPQSPIASDQTHTFARPSWDYPLGTDQLGRDMLSRVIHGSRISLAVGVSSVLLALFVGVPLGMIAGYYGGRVDTGVMRVMDLILAFPIYLLAIILMVIFTPTAGLIGTMKVTGAIAIVRIPIYARLVRGSVLSIKEKEYIEACRALGVRDPWILFRHVLPNCLAPIIVTTTLGIATSIIVEATLSFLGLGTQPPDAELGLGPQGQRGVHPVQRLALALPGPRHLRDRARLQSLRRRPPRRPRPPPEVASAPPPASAPRVRTNKARPHAPTHAVCDRMPNGTTGRADDRRVVDAPRRDTRAGRGWVGGRSGGGGRRDPFPTRGDGRDAPGWSPAAAEQRARAAWSSRPPPPLRPPTRPRFNALTAE